jgi:ribosomal protein L11 methyltransferase
MNSDWIEIKIHTDPGILEVISPRLFSLGFEGITEEKDYFLIYIPGQNWNEKGKKSLVQLLKENGIAKKQFEIKIIRNQNWNENWKENFKTFRVGKNIIIQPDWENYQKEKAEIVLTIAPKMAFGTGHHQTTQLILMQLEQQLKPGMKVLDAGTGSGILAIYAAKKQAKKVTAFDNDQEAIINAQENCALNSVYNIIRLLCCDINTIKPEPFDLIIANINRNILLQWVDKFKNFASDNTKLVLSGLLTTDRDEIVKVYTDYGWKLISGDQMDEWISLIFELNKK